ncbi:MAG: 50S ribosomal protein L16 [Candidatus Pacebacteria bacterium CG_4_10_14_0_8_um_filter_43_12]|nr:MAG: 50S ribosomal protein L16 [Candidatus Pacebacteria bacterium CG10_big_fil_rev_8_21_14_0_10_44_11]PIY79551.1 MAG: 50S ribosomal protein L16 [Candidatus Pacebacteria bacterium CG_4_10_14_0_8_um_filter_43_12]
MLQPRKEKFRKQFRGKMRGTALKGSSISFGEYGLKALTSGWVSAREIEAARKKITFMTKRAGKYWVRVFPDKPVTKKPVGVKMGSGKGPVDEHVAVVKPGAILFELSGVTKEIAVQAFSKAGHKLSVKTVLIEK